MTIYTVQPGDSIYTIARKFNVPMQKVINDNGLNPDQLLVIGQAIVIIPERQAYTVKRGDSLYTIARRFNTSVDSIMAANPEITNPARIYPGQVINIPSEEKLGTIKVNGFALPGITAETLNATLPFLTYISPFSYMVRPDGSLTPLNDMPIITPALEADVAPWMVITNLQEGEGFSSELARTILTTDSVQDTLLTNVVNTMRQKNYKGLVIDFEYIFPQNREDFNRFISKVAARLRPLGYTIASALAPKLSANQQGLLYEAHDYPVHGRIMDFVILMTYEWGYIYGPAQAVAPADQVEKVLQYATSVIPSEKILMGMPNYGYDWTLPFVQGSSARSITNNQAISIARRVGANIQFDSKAQAPFFRYYDEQGRQHEVWFDDARSIQARLKSVQDYNLAGVSYWTINNFFAINWLVLSSMYDVEKVM